MMSIIYGSVKSHESLLRDAKNQRSIEYVSIIKIRKLRIMKHNILHRFLSSISKIVTITCLIKLKIKSRKKLLAYVEAHPK